MAALRVDLLGLGHVRGAGARVLIPFLAAEQRQNEDTNHCKNPEPEAHPAPPLPSTLQPPDAQDLHAGNIRRGSPGSNESVGSARAAPLEGSYREGGADGPQRESAAGPKPAGRVGFTCL